MPEDDLSDLTKHNQFDALTGKDKERIYTSWLQEFNTMKTRY